MPGNQYIEAHNVELVGESNFFALRNISGTTSLTPLSTNPATRVLKDIPCELLVGGVLKKAVVYFTCIPSTVFNIWAYDIAANYLYKLYQEDIDGTYYSTGRVLDAVVYPEGGVDYVLFTDDFHEVRFLKCEIPDGEDGVSPFLTEYDLSLQRRGANGTIALTSVAAGGNLFSGTYQFVYRMVDPTNKKFTRWSTMTNPVHVYSAANSDSPVYSGVGLPTTRKVTLSITPSTEETDHFEYLQVAVIENIGVTVSDANGVTTAEPTVASLLEITEISGTSLTVEYKSNSRVGTIPIADITVDLAQIDTVKTLTVAANRLFGANVTYKELEFDNDNPTVTSGSIATQTLSTKDAYSSDDFASRYVGYWRDELYRFGIVYHDKYGNKSKVYPLDLTNKITGNQSSTIPDVRFPARSTSNSYAIFNSSNEIRVLGLQLNGITNHPTWAVAFEIVRVKRKKDILFQSPIIPMSPVFGLGALDNYPIRYTPAASQEVDVPDAQPQTSAQVLVPKNLFWPEQRFINKRFNESGTGTSTAHIGECTLQQGVSIKGFQFSMIFPSPSMYGDTPFVYSGSEKLDFVDYALLKLNVNDSVPTKTPVVSAGDDINTNVSGNFYALNEGQYYFDSTWAAKSISSTYKNVSIVDYEFFDSFGQPASVSGVSVMDYDALQTQGLDWGFKPNIQRSAVIKLAGSILPDLNETQKVFKNATLNAYVPGDPVTSQNTIDYETNLTNKFLNAYTGFSDGTTYVGAIGVINVKLGLGNDRYGDINSFHEYISTGAKYTFSDAERTTLEGGGSVSKDIAVYGGDCFIGPQTFKVCDSTYSVVNQAKNNGTAQSLSDLISKWGGKVFLDNGNSAVLCAAVPVENAAQYVEVVLESEYSEVRDTDTISSSTPDSGMPIYNTTGKEAMRVPLSYKYNLNLSKQNDRKIFVPKPLYSFELNDFPARIVYSDLKIYNSDQVGFDIFRVGNIYDLEESRRPVTKLAVAGDNMYAIQEQGVVYVPTGQNLLESADAGLIAVGSDQVIGKPRIIDAFRGSQHQRGIVETGNVIYIPDNLNKSVYVLAGQELKPIIENNATQFRTFFASTINGRNLVGIYDPVRREYWLVNNAGNVCEVFNEERGWIGNYDFTNLGSGVSVNQGLYLIGRDGNNTRIYSMYTGDPNHLMGVTVTPRVTFIVNPAENFSKTFDNFFIASSEALSTVDVVTKGASTTQTVTGTSVDVTPYQGGYKIQAPLDSSDARLRGAWTQVTLKWKATQAAVNAFYTKVRLSSRTPW